MTIAVSKEASRDFRPPRIVRAAGWAMLWLAFVAAAAILAVAAAMRHAIGPAVRPTLAP